MVGRRGWFESLQTTSRVSSSTSIEQNEAVRESLEAGGLPAYNSALVYIIASVEHTLPSGFKCVQVHTLLKETITLAVHTKCKVRDVYLCCCSHLKMKESWLLGLASRIPSEGFGCDRPRHEYFFLDSSSKVSKYGLRNWRLNYPWSSHSEGRPFLVLHLRVRIYISDAHVIRCPEVLNYYYLQLRENLLDQWSSPNSVSEERCWEMASLAYQADSFLKNQSDINDSEDKPPFRAEHYFPLWVINTRGLDFMQRNMRDVESDNRIRSKDEAVREYCQLASKSPFAINCHLYGLRQYKMDTVNNAFIGITAKGVEMSDVGDDGGRNVRKMLPWREIVLLSFDKRKLKMLGANGSCTCLYAQSEEKARYLFEFCRTVHQALISINQYFFAYKDCDSRIPLTFAKQVPSVVPEPSVTEFLLLRQSPVSRVSSNSTSGVVSDKPGSETDREYDWVASCSAAEVLSSSNTSPKSDVERQKDLDVLHKSMLMEERQSWKNRVDDTLTMNVSEERLRSDVDSPSFDPTAGKSYPKPLTVDTSLGKGIPRLSAASFGFVPAVADQGFERSYPKPPAIDTSVGRQCSKSPANDATKRQTATLQSALDMQHDMTNGTPSNSSRTLVSEGEIVGKVIEDEIDVGLPLSLAEYYHADDCSYGDESPLRSAVETSESHREHATVVRRLRPSNSVNIASIYKRNDRRAEERYAAWAARTKNSPEPTTNSCSVSIKQPPLYAEAISANRNPGLNIHPPTNTKQHMKPRWKTVAGITDRQEPTYAEQQQQFQYYQGLARSEQKLDLQMALRSTSPPPALHHSMQQLPIVQSQQSPESQQQFVSMPVHAAGTAGKFQKQTKYAPRCPRPQQTNGINRVQSMPAHNPPRIQIYDTDSNDAATTLHHTHSMAARPLNFENKQPPSYEHAIFQQSRGRFAQAGCATPGSGDQPLQSTPTEDSDEDKLFQKYPMMRLLLQEHQQENMEMLSHGSASRAQTSATSNSHRSPQVSGETVAVAKDDRLLDPPPAALMDMRPSMTSSSLSSGESRPYRLLPAELLDEVIFGDQPSYMQQPVFYRGGCHTEQPLVFRQYAPYAAEQQAAHTSWNPIPPPPPYQQPRSSPSALEAPMVM